MKVNLFIKIGMVLFFAGCVLFFIAPKDYALVVIGILVIGGILTIIGGKIRDHKCPGCGKICLKANHAVEMGKGEYVTNKKTGKTYQIVLVEVTYKCTNCGHEVTRQERKSKLIHEFC